MWRYLQSALFGFCFGESERLSNPSSWFLFSIFPPFCFSTTLLLSKPWHGCLQVSLPLARSVSHVKIKLATQKSRNCKKQLQVRLQSSVLILSFSFVWYVTLITSHVSRTAWKVSRLLVDKKKLFGVWYDFISCLSLKASGKFTARVAEKSIDCEVEKL